MPKPALRVRNEFEFRDVAERAGLDPDLLERDFALMTVAAELVGTFGDQLCFKGGFVLRHVHGHERFSKDIDATRINPPKHKFEAEQIAAAINGAGTTNLLTLRAPEPKTDSRVGLDFEQIQYRGPVGQGSIAVEVSYREAVVLEPEWVAVGEPYYEPFDIPVMRVQEIVAEKIRTLVQRSRPTDLSDLAQILVSTTVDAGDVTDLVRTKFTTVKQGDPKERIEDNLVRIGNEYEATIRAVAPDAPSYGDAVAVVRKALPGFLP